MSWIVGWLLGGIRARQSAGSDHRGQAAADFPACQVLTMYLLQPTAGGDAPRHGEGRVERGMWVCPPGAATWGWLQDQYWARKRPAALNHPCLGWGQGRCVPTGVTALVGFCVKRAASGMHKCVRHVRGEDVPTTYVCIAAVCGCVAFCSLQQLLRAAWEKGVMASPPVSPVLGAWASGGTLCAVSLTGGWKSGGWWVAGLVGDCARCQTLPETITAAEGSLRSSHTAKAVLAPACAT